MRLRSVLRLTAVAVVSVICLARAAANPEPRTVTLAPGPRTVAETLAAIETQTGNRVLDRRGAGAMAKVDIGFDKVTFWQALDQLARKLDAQVSLYHDDAIRLVDGPNRGKRAGAEPLDVGVCRVEIKNLAVQRDLDNDRRTCVAQLEVAWEPRYEPIYLTVDNVRGAFAADAKGIELAIEPLRGIAQQVTQRRAQLVELRMPAPDRSSPSVATLKGELKFLGPKSMVTATFANPKAGDVFKDAKESVTVTLRAIAVAKDAWTFNVDIENPKDTPPLESFQQATWIENNRIHLERIKNGVKETWTPNLDEGDVDHRRAKLRYHFAGAANKGPLSDWTLVVRTPGRIEQTSVPFEFRNVALP